MADDTSPEDTIAVNDSAVPGNVASAFRSIIMVGGAWAVGKGYIGTDTLNTIIGMGMIVLPFAYGQWKRYEDHAEKRVLAITSPVGTIK
jgi:hypothetical protein